MEIELDKLTELELEGLFAWEKVEKSTYEFYDNVQQAIFIENDLNLYRINRTVYTGFDLLSDVGGI